MTPERLVRDLAFMAQQAADVAAHVETLPFCEARRKDMLADLLKANILTWQKSWREQLKRKAP